jgi:hypothetical protein
MIFVNQVKRRKGAFMKRLTHFLLTSTLLLSVSVLAAIPTLKENMGALGKLSKAISQTVNDPSKNAASAAQADQMVKLFVAVRDQVPDTITQLPPDRRPAAIAEYKSIIQREIDGATALAAAFRANDNVRASTILHEMLNDRQTGHEKFKAR